MNKTFLFLWLLFGVMAIVHADRATNSLPSAVPLDRQQWYTDKDIWVPVVSAFFGALVGGLFVLKAAAREHEHNLHRDKLERQKNINGVLRAIKNELEILEEIYATQIGGILENVADGGVLTVSLSLQNQYFIVYPKNTHIVGQIEDTKLVKSIIVTYNTASVLIDAFWINNKYVEQAAARQMEGAFMNHWAQQTAHLKSLHKSLHRETESLLNKIDNYLSNQTAK